MRSGNVNHVFANGFSLLDDDPSGPNDFSQNFPFQGGAVRQRVEFEASVREVVSVNKEAKVIKPL